MFRAAQRPVRAVPKSVLLMLAAALALQIAFVTSSPRPVAHAATLDPPPSGPLLAYMQGFDRLPSAHLIVLNLQAYDNQPGVSIPFMQLDYARVTQWLSAALQLDPIGQYPLLMAAELYAQVPSEERMRAMLSFVHDQFGADPNRRWQWLAHAAIMAKHRLHDLPTALKYAQEIHDQADLAPSWARQMHIFLLEDMGEYETAQILLGGLLASDQVTDSHERFFLLQSLDRIKAAENSSAPTK
jgi:hypothetical protein